MPTEIRRALRRPVPRFIVPPLVKWWCIAVVILAAAALLDLFVLT